MSEIPLKKLIKQLGSIKGRYTELVTVYVPAGYSLHEVSGQLRSEQGTAENIKSKGVRKNVVSSLEKIIRHLQLYSKTPPNGLALFCGNVSEKEGVDNIKLFPVEPPEPIKTKLYWCDQRFVLEPLEEMVKEKEVYGIICLDKSEADIAILSGKKIMPMVHFDSIVPGKTRAGGQCLVADSLVQMSDGEILEIKDVHNPSAVKSAEFGNFTLCDSPVIDKWDVSKPIKYRIVTKLPRTEISCSADHLFFVWGDEIKEVPASDMKVGNYLLMPERIDIKGELQALNSTVLYNSYKISEEGRRFLSQKRKNMRIFQKELARRVGATQAAISVIELNKRDVKAGFLYDICKELDIDYEMFIRRYCIPKSDIKLPEILNEKLAQILGYFAGDGSFEEERLSFHEKDENTIRFYEILSKLLFNCNTHLRFRENKGFWVLRIHGKPVVRLLKREFPEIKGYSDTEIPKKVLKSENPVLASFLRGFFDAEGYVTLERGVGLGINNKKLAKQVQMSLLRFGILASLHEYDNRKNPYSKETRFTISITEKESLNNFLTYIGFDVHYKREKLEKVLKNKSSTSYVRRIAVSGRNIRKILEQNGMKIADFPKVTNFFRNERLMSKEVFVNSILREIEKSHGVYEKLKPVLNYNLVPVKIAKIEKTVIPSQMIDISVKNQSFIANGIMTHNSSARFARVREGLLEDWMKKVGEAANKLFEEHKELVGIIVSGSGPVKDMFLKGGYLYGSLMQKVIGTVDTSYTGEFGLHETVERGEDLLKESAVVKEKKLLQRFLEGLNKPHGLIVYGVNEVIAALEMGAVDTVIVSEGLEMKEIEYECVAHGLQKKFVFPDKRSQKCGQCQQMMHILGERDVAEAFEERVKSYGTKLMLVSVETREGQQFLYLGGVGAILRYNI